MADLVSATGLLRGSIYQAFGDKHTLFLQSLDLYLGNMQRRVKKVMDQSTSPLEGFRNALHCMVDVVDSDSQCPGGCMAVNTVVERVPTDADVRKVMLEQRKRMAGMMGECLGDACAAGQVTLLRTPEQTVALVMTFVMGLAVTMKGPLNKAGAHQLLDLQMDALL